MFRERIKGHSAIPQGQSFNTKVLLGCPLSLKGKLLDGIEFWYSNLFHGSEGRAKVDVDDLAGKQTQASRLEVLHRRQRAQGKHRVLEKEEQIEFRRPLTTKLRTDEGISQTC